MRSSPQLVVDAGAGHVAGAVFRRVAGGRLVLEEFALELRPTDPALDPGWMESTATAFAAVSARRGIRGSASLAVPGHLTLTKFVKTPAVSGAQREQVIEFEAAQNIPFPLDAVVWDHLVVAGDDLEIMLTAVKRDVMENLCAAAEAAGFPVQRAASSCLALYQAFRFNYPSVTAPVLVLDVGARSTNLLLIGPGGRFFARNFPVAGNVVTSALASELQLDFSSAEMLKLRASAQANHWEKDSVEVAAVQCAAQAFIDRFQMEVMRTMGNFSWRTGAPRPVAIYLTGGGSRLTGLAAALAGKFNLQVEGYDPLRQVELSENARAAGAAAAVHLLANLVGMAAPMRGTTGVESGLLPPAVRASREFRRRQPRLVGAATLLVIALFAPLWHFHRVASARMEQAAVIDGRLPALRVQAERNSHRLAQLTATWTQVAALQRVASANSSWVGFMGDVQDRLGKIEDVWLDQLTVVPPPATKISGGAGGIPASNAPLQLRLQGRMLDPRHPDEKASADSHARVRELLASMARSPYIAAIEGERFDNSQPGLLRFDFTLAVSSQHPL